ncbi:MAG TPA: chromosome segregation protein SMC [Alphaproteobacteria bacterium]|nr:chromosome segregation protein SMC [Alphaproteobacteria bacterium]
MVQFTKLRLSGFKSFVDPTELLIEPGLTGVVGPNGCGKSNIVDALRWAMGEHSARQLRGGEMDDVIFGGTSNRPARNHCEVSITLDNGDRTAPAAFNENADLEVTRRIDRGEGSSYKINGMDVRARDVQLLFADAASGSRSTAIVSQGQVGAVIAAKPTERRAILEEAAGITGLYSRRHEAELRLRAAEANLARLDDVIAALDAQHQSLKKQARQATRYRNLSDHIRKAEAQMLHLRWVVATKAIEEANARYAAAELLVEELTVEAATAAAAQAEAAAALPPLREMEAECAAKLQRLLVAREQLQAEETRINAARAACEHRLAQINGDMSREQSRVQDAEEAIARLAEEALALEDARAQEEIEIVAATEALEEAKGKTLEAEVTLTRTTEEVAAVEAQRREIARRLGETEARHARLTDRIAQATREREIAAADAIDKDALAAAGAAAEEALAALENARAEAASAEAARVDADKLSRDKRDELQTAESAAARLRAEEKALGDVLAVSDNDLWPPLIDAIAVQPGFETALGVALGDDLTAPADEAAPIHWRSLPPLTEARSLPGGLRPLADFVEAPAALARRLGQIGLVEDDAQGRSLSADLALGQRLVSRSGALWRWDGYTVAAGTTTAAAARLTQRNRLKALRGEVETAEEALEIAREASREARDAADAASEHERAMRDASRSAERALDETRSQHAKLSQADAAVSSKLAALEEALAQLTADYEETAARLEADRAAQAELPDEQGGREKIAELRAQLAELRSQQGERQRAYDLLAREAENRRNRLSAISHERASWQGRADNATQQLAEFAARKATNEEELAELAARPEQIAEERHILEDQIGEAEGLRKQAADALAAAETLQVTSDRALKSTEGKLASAREERVRGEGVVGTSQQVLTDLTERIAEKLQCPPENLLAIAEVTEEELQDQAAAEARFERLTRERDNMGPVNLRAEVEATELEEKVAGMQSEREDLIQAIARLRQGINELNREGRERFLAAFEAVNKHFTELFTRLFGGGTAHLQLTEAEDPLEAGLEIMASPPGKKLQVLSLLSGGEKALTTTALLFAVFMTNPAPICVLDEVDAPLDDSNITRFCNLVEEIGRRANTRFLVITHHRHTMARMDRLFGVTMPERGVSQLVSVDLKGVSHLRAIA